ncbi:MAG: TetR/AcrR family transcriptional regulator [Pseudomonadota bacterium]
MSSSTDFPDALSERTRILDAAEPLARRFGYFGFSVADTAERCGIGEADVLRHFADRSDLSAALVERYTSQTIDILGDPGAQDAMERLVAAYSNAAAEDGEMCLCSLYGAEVTGLPPSVARVTRDYYRKLAEWIRRALRCKHEDKHPAAVIASLCGALVTVKNMNDPDSFDLIAWQLIKPVTQTCLGHGRA